MQRTDNEEEGIMGTVIRMLCGLIVIFLVGAVQPKTSVAGGNVIEVDGKKIEFFRDSGGEWAVKKDGREEGKAKKLKNVELTVHHEDGSSVKPLFVPNSSLVYKYNPTCVAYTDGARWYQYCW